MKKEIKNNGLRLLSITSESDNFKTDDFRKLLVEKITEKSFVVAYLDYKVLIGIFDNGDFAFFNDEKFEDKFVQRIRVFNQNEEFLAWRISDGFGVRFRQDNKGNDTVEVVEAFQALFGTKVEIANNNFSRIKEEKRGTELVVPLNNLSIDDRENRLFIKTRNYIKYDSELHQATYFDSRFVTFSNKPI